MTPFYHKKLADNIIEKPFGNMDEDSFKLSEFYNYLGFFIELLKIDTTYTIEILFGIEGYDSSSSKSKFFLSLLFYLIFIYIFNKKKTTIDMGKVWLRLRTDEYSKRFCHFSVYDLVIKYKEGRRKGIYKSLESFREELNGFPITLENFSKVVQMHGSLKGTIRRKLAKKMA